VQPVSLLPKIVCADFVSLAGIVGSIPLYGMKSQRAREQADADH